MAKGTGLDDASRSAALPAPALAAWQADSGLAAALADAASIRLVLDADGSRVLDASEPGRQLLRRIGRPDALPAHLAGQVLRGAGPAPRLLRLRLDPRGVAPPSLCRLARAEGEDGRAVFLLVVAGPLPNLRAPAIRQADPDPDPVAEAPPASASEPPRLPLPLPLPLPQPGSRFLWRTDAAGALTQISDGQDALADFVGQSWEALAQAGRVGGATEALLAALAAQRTFRALGLDLRTGTGSSVSADLSGAPAAPAGQPFVGFGGFGIVRADCEAGSDAARDAVRAEAPPAPAPAAPVPAAALASDPIALATMAAPFFAAWIGQTWFGEPCAAPPSARAADAPADPPAPEAPEPAASAAPEPTDAPVLADAPLLADESSLADDPAAADSPLAALPEAGLSLTEHDAFREIARALGARYAGDEEPEEADPDGASEGRSEGASVTFFPGARPPAETEPALLLEGIPGAVLVYRGNAILAANRALLALAGYADLAALQAAGPERLFRGLPPERHAGAGEEPVTVAIEAADGTGRPVAVTCGRMVWPGGPAACLLLRPVSADDPEGRHAAEDLARRVRETRGTDALAALDAIDDGVAILDGAGRVLGLNRAASALFACDPREVVGGAFGALFPPEAVPAVQAVLDGRPADGSVTLAGRTLALRIAPLPGDRRAAVLRVLDRPDDAGGLPALASGFLGTLDRGIRTPLTGILGFADVILKEPYGPLGHPRYRAYLQDVRTSGEQVLGLVTDLIDLATIEGGGLPLVREPLPLNELIAACVAELQPEAARSRIVLRTSFGDDLPPLEADRPTMARAVRIVIANAIRLSGLGGQVIVSTTMAEAGTVALRVRDTGAGLSADEIAAALEPFAGAAAARPEIGGGLALPLMRALVEANDGALHISSRKDEGTLVEIRLPATRAAKRA
jgi:signal transduction histidine kinase